MINDTAPRSPSGIILYSNQRNDIRLSIINNENATGKRILRYARTAAIGHLDNDKAKHARALKNLLAVMKPLDLGDLNCLGAMIMAVPVHPGMMAMGRGGIWAAATEQINHAAREVSKGRPAFELVS